MTNIDAVYQGGGLALFDRAGGEWPFLSTLAHRLGTHLQGNSLVDYVVRNMGYVAVEPRGRAMCVRVRPALAASPALAAAIARLQEHKPERVLMRIWHSGWQDQLLPTSLFLSFAAGTQAKSKHGPEPAQGGGKNCSQESTAREPALREA